LRLTVHIISISIFKNGLINLRLDSIASIAAEIFILLEVIMSNYLRSLNLLFLSFVLSLNQSPIYSAARGDSLSPASGAGSRDSEFSSPVSQDLLGSSTDSLGSQAVFFPRPGSSLVLPDLADNNNIAAADLMNVSIKNILKYAQKTHPLSSLVGLFFEIESVESQSCGRGAGGPVQPELYPNASVLKLKSFNLSNKKRAGYLASMGDLLHVFDKNFLDLLINAANKIFLSSNDLCRSIVLDNMFLYLKIKIIQYNYPEGTKREISERLESLLLRDFPAAIESVKSDPLSPVSLDIPSKYSDCPSEAKEMINVFLNCILCDIRNYPSAEIKRDEFLALFPFLSKALSTSPEGVAFSDLASLPGPHTALACRFYNLYKFTFLREYSLDDSMLDFLKPAFTNPLYMDNILFLNSSLDGMMESLSLERTAEFFVSDEVLIKNIMLTLMRCVNLYSCSHFDLSREEELTKLPHHIVLEFHKNFRSSPTSTSTSCSSCSRSDSSALEYLDNGALFASLNKFKSFAELLFSRTQDLDVDCISGERDWALLLETYLNIKTLFNEGALTIDGTENLVYAPFELLIMYLLKVKETLVCLDKFDRLPFSSKLTAVITNEISKITSSSEFVSKLNSVRLCQHDHIVSPVYGKKLGGGSGFMGGHLNLSGRRSISLSPDVDAEDYRGCVFVDTSSPETLTNGVCVLKHVKSTDLLTPDYKSGFPVCFNPSFNTYLDEIVNFCVSDTENDKKFTRISSTKQDNPNRGVFGKSYKCGKILYEIEHAHSVGCSIEDCPHRAEKLIINLAIAFVECSGIKLPLVITAYPVMDFNRHNCSLAKDSLESLLGREFLDKGVVDSNRCFDIVDSLTWRASRDKVLPPMVAREVQKFQILKDFLSKIFKYKGLLRDLTDDETIAFRRLFYETFHLTQGSCFLSS
jgi:hypothetical protein